MLGRPLRDLGPRSAMFADPDRVAIAYRDERELRAWPSFQLLSRTPTGSATLHGDHDDAKDPVDSAIAARIEQELGGSVEAMAAAPSGLVAALWTPRRYPMWYRVVVCSQDDPQLVVTPEPVRVWGRPCWSPTGELAVGVLDGIRLGIMVVNPADATMSWWRRPASASYRLLALGLQARDCLAVRADAAGSAWLVRGLPGGDDQQLRRLRAGDAARVHVVGWTHGDANLEGLLWSPPAATPPCPTVVFLHGGPVGGLICGEHPDVSAWTPPGLAVFLPDFRSSGIAGWPGMLQAFQRQELPRDDPEATDVLTGVDLLVARGLADPDHLILLGHSYGGYLANRIVTRDHRFRLAVCCDGAADLRLLDMASKQRHAAWLGGEHQAPHRWAAASPIERADQVHTPMLLVYAEHGGLALQGQAWHRALTAAGVDSTLIVLPGEDHSFASPQSHRRLRQALTGPHRRCI